MSGEEEVSWAWVCAMVQAGLDFEAQMRVIGCFADIMARGHGDRALGGKDGSGGASYA